MPRFSSVRLSRPSTPHQLHVSTLDVLCFNLQLYPTVLKFAGISLMSIQSEHLFIQVDIHVFMSWVAVYELACFLLGSFLLLRNTTLMELFNPCLPSVTGNVSLAYLLFIANRILFLFLGKFQVENCFVFNFHVVKYVSLFFMVCGFDVNCHYPCPHSGLQKYSSKLPLESLSYFCASVCAPSGVYFGVGLFSPSG